MNGMKRGIILFAALLVAGMTAEAQTQNTFGGGDIVLSAGMGRERRSISVIRSCLR